MQYSIGKTHSDNKKGFYKHERLSEAKLTTHRKNNVISNRNTVNPCGRILKRTTG